MSLKYGAMFEAGMGADAILKIMKDVNLDDLRKTLIEEGHSPSGQRRRKAGKQLQVVEAFRRSGNKPEWMILTVLPVLPPDLRPMVQLDGGRFAISATSMTFTAVLSTAITVCITCGYRRAGNHHPQREAHAPGGS